MGNTSSMHKQQPPLMDSSQPSNIQPNNNIPFPPHYNPLAPMDLPPLSYADRKIVQECMAASDSVLSSSFFAGLLSFTALWFTKMPRPSQIIMASTVTLVTGYMLHRAVTQRCRETTLKLTNEEWRAKCFDYFNNRMNAIESQRFKMRLREEMDLQNLKGIPGHLPQPTSKSLDLQTISNAPVVYTFRDSRPAEQRM